MALKEVYRFYDSIEEFRMIGSILTDFDSRFTRCYSNGWRLRTGDPRGEITVEYFHDHHGVIVYRYPYSTYSRGRIYPGMEGNGSSGREYLPGEPVLEDEELLSVVRQLTGNGINVLDAPIECVCEAVVGKIIVGAWTGHRRRILHGSTEEMEEGAADFFQEIFSYDWTHKCPVCGRETIVEITPQLLKELGLK